jgi:lysozyme
MKYRWLRGHLVPDDEQQRLSEEGLAMLMNFEGTVLHRYLDQAGVMTVGTGHALTAAEKAAGAYVEGITRVEAKELLRLDVAKAEEQVRTLVKVPLKPHQFDALVSFTFNLGGGALQHSQLLVQLNQGNYGAVPLELVRWMKRRDPRTGLLVEDSGLLARRRAEAAVWVNGYVHKDTEVAFADAAAIAAAHQLNLQVDLESGHVTLMDEDEVPPTDRNT